ncbi:MAG: 5-formyltetrahydrofolate cyclo-ligase [Alphaproteobacteria bacterium]
MSEPSSADIKATLRREALANRDMLDPALRKAASADIVARLAQYLREIGAGSFAAYVPIRNEVDLTQLFTMADELGVVMALPAQLPDGLIFRQWRLGEPLIASNFRVREPRGTAPSITPEIIFLPVAGFDRAGHRLGYGQGHYDRAIAELYADGVRPVLFGVAYATQEVAFIPPERHDIGLDAVVTEAELIDFRGAPAEPSDDRQS